MLRSLIFDYIANIKIKNKMTQSYREKKTTGWKTSYALKTITFPYETDHKKYSRRKYLIIVFY
jgi:hypothetical protein